MAEKKDNWEDRSNNMRCKTCIFNVIKKKSVGVFVGEGEKKGETEVFSVVGRCRRHSPTMSGWPVVYPTDWCGDHKLDENKL